MILLGQLFYYIFLLCVAVKVCCFFALTLLFCHWQQQFYYILAIGFIIFLFLFTNYCFEDKS